MPDYYNTNDNTNKTLWTNGALWIMVDILMKEEHHRCIPLTTDLFRLVNSSGSEFSDRLSLLPIYQGITEPVNTNQQAYLLSATTHNLNGANPTPSEFFMLEYRKNRLGCIFTRWRECSSGNIDYNQSAWITTNPIITLEQNKLLQTTCACIYNHWVALLPPGAAFTSGSLLLLHGQAQTSTALLQRSQNNKQCKL